jgi:DNA repair protein SbcC/Rad50
MKFKRIEISAFRIYDNPEDATFDFTTEEGDVADFVSLYAPNGFGKTSFYDAVEWGITNNIQRFWQNSSVAEKSIDALKEVATGPVKLWRHTNSENDTYVKIVNEKSEVLKRDLHMDGRSTIDAKKELTVNKDFRQVVLSQEWISAFLREINGEQRYKIFMENPDLKDLDNYYKGLKSLLGVCNERINALDLQIENSKTHIIELAESNLLDTINSTISLLINFGEEIALVSLDMSTEQVLVLRNKISNRIVSCNANMFNQFLANITLAKSGTDDLIGVERYFAYPVLKDKAIQEIRSYDILIRQFNQLTAFSAERDNNLRDRSVYHSRIDQIDKVLGNFPEFNRIVNLIIGKKGQIQEGENAIKGLKERVEADKRLLVLQESDVSSLFKQTRELQDRILRVPIVKSEIEVAEVQLTFLNEQKDIITALSDLNENNIKEKQKKIDEYNYILFLISSGDIQTISHDILGNFADVLSRLESNINLIAETKVSLDRIDSQIDQNQLLNSSLQELIKKGLDIVNGTKASSCPLCNQNYASYVELTNKISENTALNEGLQLLFKQRSELSAISLVASNQVIADKVILADFYQNLITLEQKEINDFTIQNKGLQIRISEMNQQLASMDKKIQSGREELRGELPDKLLSDLTISLGDQNSTLGQLRERLNALKLDIENKEKTIEIESGKVNLLKSEIGHFEKEEKYTLVLGWFLKELPGVAISEARILDEKAKLLTDIDRALGRFNQLELEINILQATLSTHSKEEIIRSKDVTQQLINRIDSEMLKFREFLKNNFQIVTIPAKKDDLVELLDSKADETRKSIEQMNKIRIEYEKLDRYAENLIPYLQSENHKISVVNAEREKEYLINQVKVLLEDERDKTKLFLEKKVKDFFYINLINSLYNKIDPHPNFKSVDFRVNFDSDNPKLDIYVINLSSEELLIPNLYFSTAQINVLSLSIFLASALNSNNYNCIFIDDPVQSLDSINILSTIDLIRSIVVNQKRQIVLSTHDENFHNLLKKKMPSRLFKSKFLELESFGKVKA